MMFVVNHTYVVLSLNLVLFDWFSTMKGIQNFQLAPRGQQRSKE